MRKSNTQKGITLIALIITIVVLLILAVVAINAVTGDGIIQHATNAKTEYEKAQDKENSMLSYYEKYLESQGSADIWDGKTSTKPEIKDGKWYIYTCSELKFFADFINKAPGIDTTGVENITTDTTVYLMSNLDLGARQENGRLITGTVWTPIGTSSSSSFEGTFEGNNHYIKGIYVDDKDGFAGLFGYSTNTIKNLTIKDGYIKANGKCVGGIVGRGDTVINCNNINTTVKQTNEQKVAGITGQAFVIENCINTGEVIGNSSLDGDTYAAGIVGLLGDEGYIKNCKNSGTVTGIGKRVAGIVASKNPPLNNNGVTEEIGIDCCINTGAVSGTDWVGGIVGLVSAIDNSNYLRLTNSYNIGNITGENCIGGIIGELEGTSGNGIVKGCYNIGLITGNDGYGSIIGTIDTTTGNTIEYCYYLNETNTDDGKGLTEDNMKKSELLNNLNLATNTGVWIQNNGEYPKLRWEV